MSFRQGQGFQSASPPLPPPPGNDGGGYRSSPPTSQRQYQQQQHQHQQLQQQQHGSYGSTGSLTPPPHMQAQRRGSPLSQPQAGGSHPRDQFQPRGSADPQSFARNQAGQQAGQRPLSYMGQPTNHQQQLQQQQRNSPLERTGGHAYSQSVSQPGDRFNAPSRSGSTHSPGPSSTGGRDQQLSGGSIARRGSTASNATSSAAAPPKPPSTIAGEPLHDLGRAIALLKSSKFYAEGFLMKKTEVGPDGKAHPGSAESEWAKWFVQLSGTIMSTWNAAEMEEAAAQNRTVPPQYLNLADAYIHPYPPSPNNPAPTQFQFALNSAGLNRVLFCAPSLQSLTMWLNSIRLACWERSRCNEIYTGTLLGLREPKPQGWVGYDGGLTSAGGAKGKFEGWLKVRLPGDTEWRRLYTTVLRGTGNAGSQAEMSKKQKRTSLLSFGKKAESPLIDGLPGDGAFSTIAFYAEKPTKKEQPLCIAQHLFYASAIYPESEKLVNKSTLFKIEGTFLNPNDGFRSGWGVGGRAEKQGYALIMLEEGDYMDMLEWIVGLSDAFKLYGRPRAFSYDPRDPASQYFALPVGPHRDRQFLDRELVDNLDINESRPRAIRAVFHNILFDRMRGVRSAALSAPPQEQSSSPTAAAGAAPNDFAATRASAPPQLAPLDTSGPLKVHNGTGDQRYGPNSGEDDGDRAIHESPQTYGQHAAPMLNHRSGGLEPIGEASVVGSPQQSTHESNGPSRGPSMRDPNMQTPQAWERSQPQAVRQDGQSWRTSAYAADEDSRRELQPQPEGTTLRAVNQSGSPYSATASLPREVHRDPSSETSHKKQSRDSRAESSNGEHMYTSYLSSDLARERTPPPASAPSFGAQSSRPAVAPIDTSRGADAGSTPAPALPSPNFSRPTPQMLAAQDSTTEQQPTTLDHVEGPIYQQQQFDRQAAPLPSPGAPSTQDFASERGGTSDVGLAYLDEHSPVPPHQNQFQSSISSPVEQTQTRSIDTQPHAPPTSQSDSVQDQRMAAAAIPDPAHTTRPLFSPPMSQDESFLSSSSSPTIGGTKSSTSPIIPPKSPGRRPSPLIDTSSLPPPIHTHHMVEPLPAVSAADQRQTIPQQAQDLDSAPPLSSVSGVSSSENRHSRGYNAADDQNIHSDLLAALHFVDRADSPPSEVHYTPVTPSTASESASPVAPQWQVGPPKRGLFGQPQAQDEDFGLNGQSVEVLADEPPRSAIDRSEPSSAVEAPSQPSSQRSPAETQGPQSFPSSFAPNKRAEERLAAAKIAEQAQQAALSRPGRVPGAVAAGKQKQKAWVDSDEDEDEPEGDDEESDEDNAALGRRPAPGSSASQQDLSSRNSLPVGPQAIPHMSSQHPDYAARQSYYENGPSPDNRSSMWPSSTSPGRMSPARNEFQNRGGSPAPAGHPTLRPVVNPHGLLHAGIIDKEERSARALEAQARDNGGPLVSIPSKPPPPQTGLVGAITSHEREKERTGGVGRALTEQQRERKMAEQRQKQLDELQRQQLVQQQMQMQAQYQMQQMQQYGSMGGMGGMGGMSTMGSMNGFGMNPWMMGGMGPQSTYGAFPAMSQGGSQMGVGSMAPPQRGQSPQMGAMSPGGMDQQQQFQAQQAMFAAQQAAQAAAQAAYMHAMAAYSSPPPASPSGSPPLIPTSYSSMSFNQQPNFYQQSNFPGPSPTLSASPSYMPQQFGGFNGFNPYQQQQQQQQQQPGSGGQSPQTHAADQSGDEGKAQQPGVLNGGAPGRVASPLSLGQRREASEHKQSLPSTPSPLDALSSQCVNFGRAAFCTTASSSAASSRLKGLKLAEKLEKVERRRARREIKSLREDAKRVESQAFAVEKQSELEAKSRISQEIAEGVEPLTNEQLDSIYRGLLAAPPQEFASPSLAGPSAELLADPSTSSSADRPSRLHQLGIRLAELEASGQVDDKDSDQLEGPLSAPAPDDVVDGASEELASSTTPSLASRLLERLVALSGDYKKSSDSLLTSRNDKQVPLGIATRSEWRDLVLACAEEGSHEEVLAALSAMQRLSMLSEGSVIGDLMSTFASQERIRECLALAEFARNNALPLSVNAHHHLLAALLPTHPELAVKHLYSLEASGLTPMLDTYTSVIRRLLSLSSPPHLVRRGWNLYAHTRLVAHPTPDAALFSEMIQACSRGPHPSPERAMDLFTEMTMDNNIAPTEQAYNGVIRALTREGSLENYFEGLRLMKQMLDSNVWPSRHTFHAVLEGARRHGDLPRARWMLVKMVNVGGDSSPDPNTIGLVFQTYAAYKPPVSGRDARKSGKAIAETAATDGAEAALVDHNPSPDTKPMTSPPPSSASAATTPVLSDLVSDDSLFFPGPMPKTASDLLLEARHLLRQCIGDLDNGEHAPSTTKSFPAVFPTSFLLDSYLAVLGAHAPLEIFIRFYRDSFLRLGVAKSRFVFERALRRCETSGNREAALTFAREVFEEWKAWDGITEDSRTGKTGGNISLVWASMIRILARNYKNDEALGMLRHFVALYPPSALLTHAQTAREKARALPQHPSPAFIAAGAYPETQRSSYIERPPYLLFDNLRLLHLRLNNVEDYEGLKALTGICRAYEGLLARAKDVEAGKSLATHRREKEAKKRGVGRS